MNYAELPKPTPKFIEKGATMKKKILASLFVFIGLLSLSPTTACALDIDGWWKASMTMQQGDFVTGEWTTLQAHGKKVSYIYIYDARENTFSGVAWLILWDDADKTYFIEPGEPTQNHYTVYNKNNFCVLMVPSVVDVDGNTAGGSTIVLRIHGTPNYATALSGFYTLYDLENVGTPDLFIRMGPVYATKIAPAKVPKEVMDLIPH
jgi:hypothetical protein